MEGAGVSRENVTPELGRLNVAHGSTPRFARGLMRDLNMSANDLQAHYDRLLTMEGRDINPVRFNELYVGADESMAFGDDPAVRIRPEQIEMTQQRLYDRMRQGESTESLRQEAAESSLLLDATTATPQSGPVRTVRPKDITMERGRIRFLPIGRVGDLGARGAGGGLGTIESGSNPMIQEGSVFELNDPLDNVVESTAAVKANPYTPTGRGI